MKDEFSISGIKSRDIEDFWIRVCLNPKEDLYKACADRAYRDLNRTIHGLSNIQSKQKYKEVRAVLLQICNELVNSDFESQNDFDRNHEQKCKQLVDSFQTIYGKIDFNVGQAQKWINMHLKYLFALGESRISGISKNYIFFHIPIDNIIQDLFLVKAQIRKIPQAWSRIDNYKTYLDYQNEVRKYCQNKIPLDVEFNLFNRTIIL